MLAKKLFVAEKFTYSFTNTHTKFFINILFFTNITTAGFVSLITGTHERAPGPYLPEFQAVCYIYLGRKGELAALLAANIIVVGALITYYVLMSKENFTRKISWSIVYGP